LLAPEWLRSSEGVGKALLTVSCVIGETTGVLSDAPVLIINRLLLVFAKYRI
jgi:hypothetical protein